MQPSSSREIFERVQELGPFLEPFAAEHAVSTTLELLSGLLLADEREALAESLPAELAQTLRSAQPVGAAKPSSVFRAMAEREGLPLGRAVELTQIVCRALSEALSPAALSRLERCLPELAPLLEASQPMALAIEFDATPRPGEHDLAGGRPGARRALATADISSLAHDHSVARSDDPHASTKLSSAHGLTQEREEQTLATAHPGAARPRNGSR